MNIMKFYLAIAAALLISGCDKKPELIKIETKKSTESEVKSDPKGKYNCLSCNIKTNETDCPKCGTTLKAKTKAKKPSHATTGSKVGQSVMAPRYGCPKCPFADAKKGSTCIKHSTIKMTKEQWFICDGCSVRQTVDGNCSKCKGKLTRTLE